MLLIKSQGRLRQKLLLLVLKRRLNKRNKRKILHPLRNNALTFLKIKKFLKKSFATIKEQGIETVILDLRGNGGGDDGYGGAILMAAQAAARIGVGRFTIVTRDNHIAPFLTQLPEAMIRSVDTPNSAEFQQLLHNRCQGQFYLPLSCLETF